MSQNEWKQLSCPCPPAQAEALGALLMEMGALGVEERPLSNPPSSEVISIAKRLAEADRCEVIAYFDADLDEEDKAAIEEILVSFGIDQDISVWTLHRDDGWSTSWKRFFHPILIGETLVICPSWEDFEPSPTQKVLRLDPGMAFGTGHHGTTRACLRLLEGCLRPGQPILDVGCGSGILSLAALLLGASHATGIDIDPDAIAVALENAEKNSLLDRCHFSTTPLSMLDLAFPVVVANIQASVLIPLAQHLLPRVEPGGLLLLSGILSDQVDDVKAAFSRFPLTFLDRLQDEEWATLSFRRA